MTTKSRAQKEYENFMIWTVKNKHITVTEEDKEHAYFLERPALQIEYAIEYEYAYGDTNAKEQNQQGFKNAIAAMNYYRRRMEAESFFIDCRKVKDKSE